MIPDYLQKMIDTGKVKDDLSLRMLVEGRCSCGDLGEIRKQNTAYADEILNWVRACDDCFEEIEAYNHDLWQQYYEGCM